MARETAKQRRDREALEQQAAWDAIVVAWPERFLNLVYEYSHHPSERFKMERRSNGTYVFQSTQEGYHEEWEIPHSLVGIKAWDSAFWEMEQAEGCLQSYRNQIAEQERIHAVRRAAVDKVRAILNEEELKLLHIS